MTHTSGPWNERTTHKGAICFGSGNTPIGEIYIYSDYIDECKHNAALATAAPDLLESLMEIELICTESSADCRKRMGTRVGNALVTARAAIAKAKS